MSECLPGGWGQSRLSGIECSSGQSERLMISRSGRRRMCVEVFLVMLAGSMLSPLHVAEAGTRWFKSKAGGYQVGIPDSWHVKEIPGRESYQAALSREQVEKPGELYRYG